MARIVLGMAMPHSGMLGKRGDDWLEDGERDRRNPELWYRNRCWKYPELEHERRGQAIEPLLSLEQRRARAARCRTAIDTLRDVFDRHRPDVAIILGKDQREIFIDTTPSLGIYTGATIENGPPQRAVFAPECSVSYPGLPELALHLIKSLGEAGFDLTEIVKCPPNVWVKDAPVVPHAYAFLYHQIMSDRPPPSVPIFMNTFYPPTQPSIGRSIAFAKALYAAIAEWDSDKTVALLGSGGLTHFVCDEELDRVFLESFRAYDFERLSKIDERSYQSGTSEVKIFVPVLYAMSKLGCDMNLVDYVPCYRTEAGTGEGMAFMYWTP